jgi:hypothetical protein
MNVLRVEPYNLRAGDTVTVKVSALNVNGSSTPTLENSNVRIFDVPEKIG